MAKSSYAGIILAVGMFAAILAVVVLIKLFLR
jgi:hypothetical protein